MVVFALFLLTPVTVSAPIRLTEAIVIGLGLAAMFALNVFLVRRALAPLEELADRMGQIDLRDPDSRIAGLEAYGPILTEFVETFNSMIDRLAEERRAGARAALAAQERERLRIGRALHDEAGQTLTAVALEIERAAADGPTEQREQMAALASQLHESLDDIRRISRDLRPEALDDLGLRERPHRTYEAGRPPGRCQGGAPAFYRPAPIVQRIGARDLPGRAGSPHECPSPR